MIKVDGYWAFRGTMQIRPVSAEPFELKGEFLYIPDTKCWYDGKGSFPAEICTVITDETEGAEG
jgi:hypothetical protein